MVKKTHTNYAICACGNRKSKYEKTCAKCSHDVFINKLMEEGIIPAIIDMKDNRGT